MNRFETDSKRVRLTDSGMGSPDIHYIHYIHFLAAHGERLTP